MTKEPTLYINIFKDRLGNYYADDQPYKTRKEATRAAEVYFGNYCFTLANSDRINLSEEFSQEWHNERVRENVLSAKEDTLRDMQTIDMRKRA